jgi:hypothetical protein
MELSVLFSTVPPIYDKVTKYKGSPAPSGGSSSPGGHEGVLAGDPVRRIAIPAGFHFLKTGRR